MRIHLELIDTLLYLINFISMSSVSLKQRQKQFSFPTLSFTRIHHKAILSVLKGLLVWY